MLLAYGQPKTSITRLQKGDYNLENQADTVLWKKKLYSKQVTEDDLHALIDNVQNNPDVTRQHPRLIIFTNFKPQLVVDTKTGEKAIKITEDIAILIEKCDREDWSPE